MTKPDNDGLRLVNCRALVYPPTLLREGSYLLTAPAFHIDSRGVTPLGAHEGVGKHVDCRGGIGFVGAPTLVLVRRMPRDRNGLMRALESLGHDRAIVVDYGSSKNVAYIDSWGRDGILPDASVVTEGELVKRITKGESPLDDKRKSRTLVLMAGMDKSRTFATLKKLGKPLLHHIAREWGRHLEVYEKLIIVTKGWLTSSDLEVIRGMRNAHLVFCGIDSLEEGLGAWMPLHEVVNDEELAGKFMLSSCRAPSKGGIPWFRGPLSASVIASLMTRYYSWKRSITVDSMLDLIYNWPMGGPSVRGVLLYKLASRMKPKTLSEIPQPYSRPLLKIMIP